MSHQLTPNVCLLIMGYVSSFQMFITSITKSLRWLSHQTPMYLYEQTELVQKIQL